MYKRRYYRVPPKEPPSGPKKNTSYNCHHDHAFSRIHHLELHNPATLSAFPLYYKAWKITKLHGLEARQIYPYRILHLYDSNKCNNHPAQSLASDATRKEVHFQKVHFCTALLTV